MILRYNEVFLDHNGTLKVSKEIYLDTEKESFWFDARKYPFDGTELAFESRTHTVDIKKIFRKENYPEYYL